MPGSLRIAIVGGGIGGLTAALALRARGLEVTVFEQAEVLREIGAGVSIHPNAARLLKRIGLDDQLRKIGSPISGITLRTSQGEAITTPAGPATPAFSPDGGQGYNVHRADFLFRAVVVPAGTREVVFAFEPASYHRGKMVSIAALAVVVCISIGAGLRRRQRTDLE